jgi:ribosomal protein S18 acetylase RimI-like enzyme
MSSLERRPARPDDFDFLLELTRASLGPYVEEIWGWDDETQRRIQAAWQERGGVEILERDGRAIGCLKVTNEPDHVFLDRVALLPDSQNRGLGTRLVREVMDDAARRGLPVRLSVLANNPARRLYERLGFRVTEVVEPRIKMEWRADDQTATR